MGQSINGPSCAKTSLARRDSFILFDTDAHQQGQDSISTAPAADTWLGVCFPNRFLRNTLGSYGQTWGPIGTSLNNVGPRVFKFDPYWDDPWNCLNLVDCDYHVIYSTGDRFVFHSRTMRIEHWASHSSSSHCPKPRMVLRLTSGTSIVGDLVPDSTWGMGCRRMFVSLAVLVCSLQLSIDPPFQTEHVSFTVQWFCLVVCSRSVMLWAMENLHICGYSRNPMA